MFLAIVMFVKKKNIMYDESYKVDGFEVLAEIFFFF